MVIIERARQLIHQLQHFNKIPSLVKREIVNKVSVESLQFYQFESLISFEFTYSFGKTIAHTQKYSKRQM